MSLVERTKATSQLTTPTDSQVNIDLTTSATGGFKTRSIAFVDLRAEYVDMQAGIDSAIREVIDGTDFVLGVAVSKFERDFARYCGVEHAVGVDSGFSAPRLTGHLQEPHRSFR